MDQGQQQIQFRAAPEVVRLPRPRGVLDNSVGHYLDQLGFFPAHTGSSSCPSDPYPKIDGFDVEALFPEIWSHFDGYPRRAAREMLLEEFMKTYHFQNILTQDDFLAEYRCVCYIGKHSPKYDVSELRKDLCVHCETIKCGNCQEPGYLLGTPCQSCVINPVNSKDCISADHKCFLFPEFQKVQVFRMVADENTVGPQGRCQKCKDCDSEEAGTESVGYMIFL